MDSMRAGVGSGGLYFYLFYFIQAYVVITFIGKKLADSENYKLIQSIGMILLFPFFVRTLWLCNTWMWWQLHTRIDWLSHGHVIGQAVKGGLIVSFVVATSLFAPLLANLAIPFGGEFIGQTFYLPSVIVFCLLVLMLISDVLRVVPVMIMRSTLAFLLCLAAPYFLSLRAVAGKCNSCIDFFRVFVEVNFWQLAWIGTLNIMSLLLCGDLNPWIKVILTICLLKFMQRLSAILQQTGMSPISVWLQHGRKNVRQFLASLLMTMQKEKYRLPQSLS